MEYAGFWVRILAIIADVFIFVCIAFIIGILALLVGVSNSVFGGSGFGFWGFISMLNMTYLGVYGPFVAALSKVAVSVAFDMSKWHGTPGKYFCGVWITEIETGKVITLKTSLIRNLVKNAPAILALFNLISIDFTMLNSISGLCSVALFFGFFACAFTEKKQALHDLIAGTTVSYRY